MKLVLIALLLLIPGSLLAGPGREALDAFLDDLTTLQATFEQSVLDTENATAGQMHGLVLLDEAGAVLRRDGERYLQVHATGLQGRDGQRLGALLVLNDVTRMRRLESLRRDFVATYKQTILGPLWYLIQPLLTTITFTVIFGRVAQLSTDGLPQFLFYMSGTVIWAYFAACLTKSCVGAPGGSGGSPPCASAEYAFNRPPVSVMPSSDGSPSTPSMMLALTSSGPKSGLCAWTNAATPETCGAAIEVPAATAK